MTTHDHLTIRTTSSADFVQQLHEHVMKRSFRIEEIHTEHPKDGLRHFEVKLVRAHTSHTHHIVARHRAFKSQHVARR